MGNRQSNSHQVLNFNYYFEEEFQNNRTFYCLFPIAYCLYLGVFRYKKYATTVNTPFGNQAAINGGKFPFTEKVVEKRSDTMNMHAMRIPRAMCNPLPPRALRLAITTPISVSNKTLKAVAPRR